MGIDFAVLRTVGKSVVLVTKRKYTGWNCYKNVKIVLTRYMQSEILADYCTKNPLRYVKGDINLGKNLYTDFYEIIWTQFVLLDELARRFKLQNQICFHWKCG